MALRHEPRDQREVGAVGNSGSLGLSLKYLCCPAVSKKGRYRTPWALTTNSFK